MRRVGESFGRDVERESLLDDFRIPRRRGRVVGSRATDGSVRRGADVERRLSIDHGALRIEPLLIEGWGREGIAYGPFERRPGLAFAAFLLNGHHASESGDIGESFRRRLRRWASGSESKRTRHRLLSWLLHGNKRITLRQLNRWARSTPERYRRIELGENLAAGWFPSASPDGPTSGHALAIRAADSDNGELTARCGSDLSPLAGELGNVPLYLVVVLRARGAIYYAASYSGTRNLVGYPRLRPMCVDPSGEEPALYAGVHQSVLGQIGFRVDTRVYGVRVAPVNALRAWYTSAHAADRFDGSGPLDGSQAEVGGRWSSPSGSFERRGPIAGLGASAEDAMALLNPEAVSGLVHMRVAVGAEPTESSILFRAHGDRDLWCARYGPNGTALLVCEEGTWQTVASSAEPRLTAKREHALQVSDDGESIGVYLNGKQAFGRRIRDDRFATGRGVGHGCARPGLHAHHDFEAHPRELDLPGELDLGAPWTPAATTLVTGDDFAGPRGELDRTSARLGDGVWARLMGRGSIARDGRGEAKVQANRDHPCADRTAYGLPWNDANSADLTAEIVAPGTGHGQREKGRAGVLFWQDPDNYLIVSTWLDDAPGGPSISSFACLGGFEDLYDAVWTNVGARLAFGRRYSLRVACDGLRYLVWLDGEPVLYRSLTDVDPRARALRISQVGIVSNWEWGCDTGSRFVRFEARA